MSSWVILDSLYCPEQYPFSHLDSYGFYIEEMGNSVDRICLNFRGGLDEVRTRPGWDRHLFDVAFFLDGYGRALDMPAGKRIAQVAALTNPLPWEVRKPDGSPAFDLVISSLRWQVKAAEGAGCKAAWMPLAFDHRALVCGMNVRERDIPCLFIGTRGGNHQRRTALLKELEDVVRVAPPTFGRSYFEQLARARVVLHCGAEWAHGEMNAMRCVESMGMGALLLVDIPSERSQFPQSTYGTYATAADVRRILSYPHDWLMAEEGQAHVLQHETYVQRVPELVRLAKEI